MCLLIHKPAEVNFKRTWLEDFYQRNNDGFGIMYYDAERDTLRVVKKPNASLRTWLDTYAGVAKGRECLIHLRMRTHGDIDFENTHPYPVVPGIWMMHNGILSQGNDGDKSKSDTWHFIEDYLKPILTRDPMLIRETAFQNLIAEAIGSSNRFAFMDRGGEITIINRDEGVEWEGAWMSNTYAWSAVKAGAATYSAPSYLGRYGSWYSEGEYDWENKAAKVEDKAAVAAATVVEAHLNNVRSIVKPTDAEMESLALAPESKVTQDMPDAVAFFVAALEAANHGELIDELEQYHETLIWLFGDSERDYWDFVSDIESSIMAEDEIVRALDEVDDIRRKEGERTSWFDRWKSGLAGAL